MSLRTVTAILGTLCLALLGYFVITAYLSGARPAGEWERAIEAYVQEYHRWLSTSPASGWARVQAMATGQERDRIENLRLTVKEPGPWEYSRGTFRLLIQAGGRALVQARDILQRGQDEQPVEEVKLWSNTVTGNHVLVRVTRRSQP